MKKIVAFFCLVFLFSYSALSQSKNIDSLIYVLETKKISLEEELKIYDEISYFYSSNNLEKSLDYASKGLQLSQSVKNRKMESVFFRNMGIIYIKKSSYDTAHMYNQKALTLAIKLGDKQLESKIYVDFGNLFLYQQNYQTAIEYYLKGLDLDESQPSRTTVVIFCNLGNCHKILKNRERAIYYFEQALELAEQLNLDAMKADSYYGLGSTYLEKNELDKADKYLQKALAISKETDGKPLELLSLLSISQIFSVKFEYNEALKYSEEALQIGEQLGSTREMCYILSAISEIYLNMKNYRESEAIALKSWIADSMSYEIAGPTAQILSIAYIHLGEKNKAEYFLRKYNEIAIKGNEKSLHESMADMEVKYETEKKELRIASLEKERQLYIWLAMAGVLLLLVTSIVLLQKIKSEQRKRQLVAAKALQEGEIGERERLASELHDRLGGTLSAAKSEVNNTKEIAVVNKKLDECIEEVRRITHNMMPLSLHLGVRAALEDFAVQFPNVYFHFFGKEAAISKRLEFVIYCCANELITNSIRHSKAEHINMQLIQEENRIALTVQDDGCGFDIETVQKGIGLNNIYNRVASCNGKIEIASHTGRGTETTIEFKIRNV